jgi:hypothetical protein
MKPYSSRSKCAARAALVLAAMAALLMATACGSSGNNGGGGGGGGDTGFSKASLNGHYAFTIRGFGLLPNSTTSEDYFVEGGVFTADGNGNVTAGTDDYVQSSVPYSDAVTGTYTVNKDGTGDLRLNFAGGAGGRGPTFTIYRITLSDTGHFYIVEDDGGATSAGSGEKQDSTLLTTTPSQTFIIRNHDVQTSATMARATISGTDISGDFYMNQGGTEIQGAFGGAGNSIGTPVNGRGTMSYVVNGASHTFFYYVVGAGEFRLIDVTPGFLSIGLAEKQSTAGFSNASLSGSYAFGSTGDSLNADVVNTVGSFTADGNTAINSGSVDSVFDGSVFSNVLVTGGNFTINSKGFGTFSLVTAQGTLAQTIWMVNPSRAYFVAVDGINAEDGTIDLQSGNFTNASLPKQAAFFMDGFDFTSGIGGIFKDRVGTLTPNGSGTLNTSYASSFFDPNVGAGGSQGNSFSGSYAVGNNGRVTTQLNGFTNNIVLYLVSNSTGYMLQGNAGVNISGAFSQQTGP